MTSTHQPPSPMRRWGAELTTFLQWVVFSCIIGVVVGGIGILFHFSIQWAGETRERFPALLWLLPLGGLFIVWLYRISGLQKDVEAATKDRNVIGQDAVGGLVTRYIFDNPPEETGSLEIRPLSLQEFFIQMVGHKGGSRR